MSVEAGRGADGPVLTHLMEELAREHEMKTLPARYRRKPEAMAMFRLIAAVAEEADRQLALLREHETGVQKTVSGTTPTCVSTENGKGLERLERPEKDEYEVVTPLAQDVCPTCGQVRKCKPLTNAERQRRYRERKRANGNGPTNTTTA